MTITAILFALLGLVLLIASLIVKPIAIRAICLIGGMVITIWISNIFGSIPELYEQDHRKVENQYHRQIISELDRMLTEGHTNEAKDLIKVYLEKTEDSSFMRNPLHEIVQSLRKEAVGQASAGQPATRSESDSEGGEKPQPESDGRSQ